MAVIDRSRLLNIEETAKFLHVHPCTVRRWLWSGDLPSHQLGPRKQYRIDPDDLLAWLTKDECKTR